MLPTHKSHVDYLVLSQVLKDNNLMMPHIAAGQNLAFWPLGWLFRSCGAFFIRRRFVDDKFYTAIVSAYVRRLVQERYAIEVFIETDTVIAAERLAAAAENADVLVHEVFVHSLMPASGTRSAETRPFIRKLSSWYTPGGSKSPPNAK